MSICVKEPVSVAPFFGKTFEEGFGSYVEGVVFILKGRDVFHSTSWYIAPDSLDRWC